jgi:hypothetical protein
MFGLYDMAGNVGELVWDTNSPRNVEPSRGSACLPIVYRDSKKDRFFSSNRMTFDREHFTYQEHQGRCNDIGFRCVLELSGPVSDLHASREDNPGIPDKSSLGKNSEAIDQEMQSKEEGSSPLKQDQLRPEPTSNHPESALAALSVFKDGTLDEAKECIHLLDDELKGDPQNERIILIKNAIMDVFRADASITSALKGQQEAAKRYEVMMRNLKMASSPSPLTGKVNTNEVNRIRRESSELKENANAEVIAAKSQLLNSLKSARTSIPPVDNTVLLPVWEKVAKRNGVSL